jgi:hypothetical protein
MRELTIRIRFLKHCLGNVKDQHGLGRYLLPRSPSKQVTFLSTWHRANLRFAAGVLTRHQDEVEKIFWDIHVDGVVKLKCWHRRYYAAGNKQRYAIHESFLPGQVVGINCVIPSAIPDEDLWQLMQLAGQYRGISPWAPGEFGFFDVESIRSRRQTFPLEVEQCIAPVDVIDC